MILTTGKPLSLAQVEVWGNSMQIPPLYNVAKKQPCFQSSISHLHGGDPNRAVDGIEDPRYNSGHTTHNDNKKEELAWWNVVLEKRFRIHEINILNRLECSKRIDKAEVFIDSYLFHTIDFKPGMLWYHIPVKGVRYGKKVEIKLNTGEPLSLSEVVVMSDCTTEPGLINLACRKTLVTQSSTGWGGDPLRAVDGSTDGVYESKGVTHTDPGKDKSWAWWHCDLEDFYKIRSVKIYNRVECADRINNAAILLGKKVVGTIQYEKGKQVYEFLTDDYSASTVTVLLTSGKPLSLAQVEVFGTGEKSTILRDIAVGRSCYQSSVAENGEANRAVNGIEDPRFINGNTTHTDPSVDGSLAWWYVDLTQSYRIFEINILSRLEQANKIDKAKVYLDSQLIHTIQYKKGCVGWYHIPMEGIVHGRRVEIKLDTKAPLCLTEVVVLSDGYYIPPEKGNIE